MRLIHFTLITTPIPYQVKFREKTDQGLKRSQEHFLTHIEFNRMRREKMKIGELFI